MNYSSLSKLLHSHRPGSIVGKTLTRKVVRYTRNHFGRIEEVQGRFLNVIERNERGDCLCVLEDSKGKQFGIIDVDHRDVRVFVAADLYTPIPTRLFTVDADGVCRLEQGDA